MPIYAEEFNVAPNKNCTKELQAACDAAIKVGGELIIKPGTYLANVELKDVRGVILRGSGRNTTIIKGVAPDKPTLRADGFWYSRIQDIGFGVSEGLKTRAVVEIDGGPKRGVQGNTFDNLAINGAGVDKGGRSRYGFAMCPNGGNGAQGSEQCFINCHFICATEALYLQKGYNALNNQFIGGNFQDFDKHGIQIIFGGIHVLGVGFQSTKGFQQILNNGWDIVADSGGVGDAILVAGCRTESLRFYKGCGAQPPQIMSCLQRHAIPAWRKGVNYKVNDAVTAFFAATSSAAAKVWIMRCQKEHTAESVPNWQSPGPLWEVQTFAVVDMAGGIIDNCNFQIGDVVQRSDARDTGVQVSEDYAVPDYVRHVFVDASKGPVKIVMPWSHNFPHGTEFTVIKGDNTPNVVTIESAYIDNESINSLNLTLKNRFIRLKALGGGTLPRRFYRVS